MVTYLLVGVSAFLFAECHALAFQVKKGTAMEFITSQQQLEQSVLKPVSLRGTALDAKAGAVVKTSGGLVYIGNLSAWPSDLVGNEVIAEGRLIRKKIMPDPVESPSGLTPQGAFGEHFVLENATWKRAE